MESKDHSCGEQKFFDRLFDKIDHLDVRFPPRSGKGKSLFPLSTKVVMGNKDFPPTCGHRPIFKIDGEIKFFLVFDFWPILGNKDFPPIGHSDHN